MLLRLGRIITAFPIMNGRNRAARGLRGNSKRVSGSAAVKEDTLDTHGVGAAIRLLLSPHHRKLE